MDWNIVAAVNSVFSICEQILRITRDEITEAQSIAKDSEYFKRFEGEMDFLKYQAQKLPNDWQHELWKQIYNIVPTDKTQCTIMLSACIAHCPIQFIECFNKTFPNAQERLCLTNDELFYFFEIGGLFLSGILYKANMLATRIIQLIISVQIDLDIIHKTTGRDLRPLLQLSPVEDKPSITTDKNPDESQATAGKPELTRKQRVSLLMHILGEAGIFISEKNGDGGISKTKMACLMNMILDGRTSIPAKNTSTPKDLSTVIDNPERYNDVLVSALENAGLTALAAKIRG